MRRHYYFGMSRLQKHVAALNSFASDVYVWKHEQSIKLGSRINILPAHELLTRDELVTLEEEIHKKWNNEIYCYASSRIDKLFRINKSSLDYRKNILQIFAITLGSFLVFTEAVKRHAEKEGCVDYCIYAPPLLHEVLGASYIGVMADTDKIKSSRLWSMVSVLQEKWVSALFALREIYQIASFSKYSGKKLSEITALWTGISPQEVPSSDGSLDCTWAVKYGICNNNVLYILPTGSLDQDKRSYLEEQDTSFVTADQIYSVVPLGERFRILLNMVMYLLFIIAPHKSILPVYLYRFHTRAIPWIELAKRTAARCYITSTSYSWPEKPEVSALNLMGVRTITWAYSANSLRFSPDSPELKGLKIQRSVLSTSEFWVWNKSYKDMLINCNVEGDARTTEIKVIGPMMCGDISLVTESKEYARKKLGLKEDGIYISVFDLPILSSQWQLEASSVPRTRSEEYGEKFYEGICGLIDEFHDINILVKPKRLNKAYTIPQALYKLKDKAKERDAPGGVIEIHPYVDPYLPIVASDICISMPFSSPVLVAHSMKRCGIYYDPDGLAKHPTEPEYRNILIHTPEHLIRVIGQKISSGLEQNDSHLKRAMPPANAYSLLRHAMEDCCA